VAIRPIFVPRPYSIELVEEVHLSIHWHSGFAPSQKQKNVVELHNAAHHQGFERVLEISTKSSEKLGVRLSAFSLSVQLPSGEMVALESAYQGSKVFSHGGPYQDIYFSEPREAKRDDRLRTSGNLVGFKFGNDYWPTDPPTAFYDWLYLFALREHSDYLERLKSFDAFSDIEFNPQRSVNCQARSCALLVSLLTERKFPEVVFESSAFMALLRRAKSAPARAQSSFL